MAVTGGATSASSLSSPSIVLMSLSSQHPPLADGLTLIRCCCRRGCRRRCPVGRRMACLACLSPVGPCCGVLARYARRASRGSPLDSVVRHACLCPMEPAGCQWSDAPSAFQTMPAAESRCWQAWRAEQIWQNLLAELTSGHCRHRLSTTMRHAVRVSPYWTEPYRSGAPSKEDGQG